MNFQSNNSFRSLRALRQFAVKWAVAAFWIVASENGQTLVAQETPGFSHVDSSSNELFNLPSDCDCQPALEYGVLARTFYLNDQRIEFTGNEATFAVEAQFDFQARHQMDNWDVGLDGELYFTQPFDQNILIDSAERRSFRGNFQIDPLEISQLFISVKNEAWTIRAGRFVSPFGRYDAPILLNSRTDVPFIRSESILFRETGVQLSFAPNAWSIDAALTNGGLNRDANSSKALISRLGYRTDNFDVGASVKWHDGIGSEGQKEFNRHFGIDLTRQVNSNLRFAGELIYDQYGMRRPGTSLDEITWGRSIYNRQLNKSLNAPITGWGYYGNLIWDVGRVQNVIGYGEFYPESIGDRIHDTVTRRLLAKSIFHFDQHFDIYGSMILENAVERAQADADRKGVFLVIGAQYVW